MHKSRRQRPWVGLDLAAFLATAVAALAPGAIAAQTPASPIVMVKDFMFAPGSLTVPAGSTVTWTNNDDEPHTVVSESGLFRSGALDTGESFSFKFEHPGTFRYACSIHPRMVATIVVQ